MKKEKGTQIRMLKNVFKIVKQAYVFDKWLLLIFFLYTIMSSLQPLLIIILPKLIIDEITNQLNFNRIIIVLVVFFAVGIISNIVVELSNAAFESKVSRVRMKFILLIAKKSMFMEYQRTESPETLDINKKSINAVYSNTTGIEGILRELYKVISNIISVIGIIIILIKFNPLILFVIAGGIFLNYFIGLKAKINEYKKQNELSYINRRIKYFQDIMYDFSFGKEIRIFNLASWLLKKFTKETKKSVLLNKQIQKKHLLVEVVDSIWGFFRDIIVYSFLVIQVLNQKIGISEFVMYIAAIASFSKLIISIVSSYTFLIQQDLYVSDYYKYINYDLSKKYIENSRNLNEIVTKQKNEFLQISKLTFIYPNSSREILKDINLSISKNEKIAIVGKNGAGKTTLVKLITGLYEIDTGEIIVNGISCNTQKKEEILSQMCVILQDFQIYALSVAENIALQKRELINRNNVINSIHLSGLSKKILESGIGIDSQMLKILDKNGIILSQGENQRLAFARALYRDKQIIIMDEPTASLDPYAEKEMYSNLNKILDNKTVIFISHRLASTKFCDRIIFLENGQIIESGNHRELMELKGEYYKMYIIQSRSYSESEKRETND
ncbi:MAG: ABC transporter ATP-binding protein/permease [Bacteroidales bacterium]|nr:ABC transporter ATP-binding protein/permease [Bacteroidales bacterium]